MIARIAGKLAQKNDQSVLIDVQGIQYEVVVPTTLIDRIDEIADNDGNVELITYHYFQIGPSSGIPILIGFANQLECDFFQQFIKVSGIGPRAAVKALSKPISDITYAIETGDVNFLKTLQGIGLQRAKEIVAKLQGKIGKYGLIQDKATIKQQPKIGVVDWQEEALSVLIQLQYKKTEALAMIEKALKSSKEITTTEELLNEIYKQKVKN